MLPSHRNSTPHFLSLFEDTKTDRLVYSARYAKLAATLQEARPSMTLFQIPEFEEMVESKSRPYPYTKTWAEAEKDPIMIIHTSGSTGAPKPITYRNDFFGILDYQPRLPPFKGAEYSGTNTWAPKNGVRGHVYSTFPPFHLAGLIVWTGCLFFDAMLVLGPQDAPVTAKLALDMIKTTRPQHLAFPPSVTNDLVNLYRDDYSECLPTIDTLFTGGGPLTHES